MRLRIKGIGRFIDNSYKIGAEFDLETRNSYNVIAVKSNWEGTERIFLRNRVASKEEAEKYKSRLERILDRMAEKEREKIKA